MDEGGPAQAASRAARQHFFRSMFPWGDRRPAGPRRAGVRRSRRFPGRWPLSTYLLEWI